jgi:glycerol kinase
LFDPPRGETREFISADAILRDVALLIDELDCMDRCVEYAVEGSVAAYAEVQAWLTEAIANGQRTIRYVVDPDHAGLVRVKFAAISPDRT